jgi:glucose/arabinose dehydrogenase
MRTTHWLTFAVLQIVLGQAIATAETVITATRFASGLARPVYLTPAPGDNDRLFVLEQHTGRIQILDRQTGQVLPDPFLDLSGLSTGNEQGLLGLAFDPNFAQNGYFYVNYTDTRPQTNIVRYQVSGDPNVADANSAQPILSFSQPQSNHNAGWMHFGPSDGMLYIATGDGGAGDDSGSGHTPGTGNAQDVTDNLLGKLLRIDVSSDAFPEDANRNYAIPPTNPFVGQVGDDEIWAYGLRNPWRNSFDRLTGDLYVADVGQGAREEINFQPAGSGGGENYGWRLREGTIATPGVGGAKPPGSVDPIYDYPHDASPSGGFSVTGGYVYRGPIQALEGHYFFADYVSQQVWSLKYDGQNVSDFQFRSGQIVPDTGSLGGIASFGEDHDGQLYLMNLDGDIFRFDTVSEATDLVPAGSTWRYLDDGTDQGSAWRSSDFDDSAWQSGLAQLGYGDNDEATVVGFGGVTTDRHETTYFRHEFDVEAVDDVEQLLLSVLRDDGAAVYLNGTEVFRTENLAPDAPYDALANYRGATAIGGAEEDTFVNAIIPGNLLVPGTNVLAVEIHQHSRSSNDLSFDLRLASLTPVSAGQPGDFNQDGTLDAADIDELTQAIVTGNGSPTYDLTGDGAVNQADHDWWVSELKQTWLGDSNLDGAFDSSDLVAVMATGHYEDNLPQNSGWAEGDWNGDLEFNSSDLVDALADGGYAGNPPPRMAAMAIPEPSALALMIGGLFLAGGHRRRRRLGRRICSEDSWCFRA